MFCGGSEPAVTSDVLVRVGCTILPAAPGTPSAIYCFVGDGRADELNLVFCLEGWVDGVGSAVGAFSAFAFFAGDGPADEPGSIFSLEDLVLETDSACFDFFGKDADAMLNLHFCFGCLVA